MVVAGEEVEAVAMAAPIASLTTVSIVIGTEPAAALKPAVVVAVPVAVPVVAVAGAVVAAAVAVGFFGLGFGAGIGSSLSSSSPSIRICGFDGAADERRLLRARSIRSASSFRR
jgi:hypothetical protein